MIHEVPWVAIYNRMNSTTTYAVLEPFTTEELGIAVPKGNEALLGEINKFVKNIRLVRTIKKITHIGLSI